MHKFFFKICLSLTLFFGLSSLAFATDLPRPTGFVNDFYGLLDANQKSNLEAELKNYEKSNGHEIALVIIGSTGGQEISMYATELGNEWGVGKENSDNGIVFLVAMEDRDFFIATGKQSEGYLTDAEISTISREIIIPHFKKEDYYGGIVEALDGIENAIRELEVDERMGEAKQVEGNPVVGFLMMIFIAVLIFMSSTLARTKSVHLGGIIGVCFGLGIGFISDMQFVLVYMVLLGGIGLFFDFVVSRMYQKAHEKKVKKGEKSPNDKGWLGWTLWILSEIIKSSGNGKGGKGGGGFGGFSGGSFGGGGGGGSW